MVALFRPRRATATAIAARASVLKFFGKAVLFLASELMFFAGLFAAYFDLRSQTIVWPPNVHLNVIESGIGTFPLGYSSGAMLMFTRSLTHTRGLRGDG